MAVALWKSPGPYPTKLKSLLSNERTQFLIPRAVTVEVRALIEAKRERSIAEPQHENEAHDAPPDLLRALWLDVYRVGVALGLAPPTTSRRALFARRV